MKKPSKFSNIDYRLVVYVFAGAIILFYVLALTGCLSDSPGIPNIFLLNIHNRGENTTQVRVGYFGELFGNFSKGPCLIPNTGICINTPGDIHCLSSIGKDTKTITQDLSHNGLSISSNIGTLLSVALTIQSSIFPCLMAAAGVFFLVGLVALMLLKRSFKKPNPRKPLRPKLFRTATMLFGGTATALAIASAVATTETANALGFAASTSAIGNDTISLSPGIALQVLQWLAVAFSVLFQLSLTQMFKVEGRINAVGTLPMPGSMGPPGPPGGFDMGPPPPMEYDMGPPMGPPGSPRFGGQQGF
ncbi:Ca2+ regulator and membrane fusion protein Fig1-domain-containing protein [Xylaria arbuscula]|nr:Ca2+ regulator and membrane fusion protein Fig1-domain-containing protein [Xylaria arbuscula]